MSCGSTKLIKKPEMYAVWLTGHVTHRMVRSSASTPWRSQLESHLPFLQTEFRFSWTVVQTIRVSTVAHRYPHTQMSFFVCPVLHFRPLFFFTYLVLWMTRRAVQLTHNSALVCVSVFCFRVGDWWFRRKTQIHWSDDAHSYTQVCVWPAFMTSDLFWTFVSFLVSCV